MDSPDRLKTDIGNIRDALISGDLQAVKPPDDLTFSDALLVNSFVILAHAHIEEFIEDVFTVYVASQYDSISDRHMPHCFARLAIHFSEPIRKEGGSSTYPPKKICLSAKALYERRVIKANNGLKEVNVTAMARPLGFSVQDLSDACVDLFPALNTLGGKRGGLAHRSTASQAASETIYPNQAIKWVDDVLDNFHQLTDFIR